MKRNILFFIFLMLSTSLFAQSTTGEEITVPLTKPNDIGSLEKGKMANLVAWSGEPLAKEAKVKMVFVDGRLHEPQERPQP